MEPVQLKYNILVEIASSLIAKNAENVFPFTMSSKRAFNATVAAAATDIVIFFEYNFLIINHKNDESLNISDVESRFFARFARHLVLDSTLFDSRYTDNAALIFNNKNITNVAILQTSHDGVEVLVDLFKSGFNITEFKCCAYSFFRAILNPSIRVPVLNTLILEKVDEIGILNLCDPKYHHVLPEEITFYIDRLVNLPDLSMSTAENHCCKRLRVHYTENFYNFDPKKLFSLLTIVKMFKKLTYAHIHVEKTVVSEFDDSETGWQELRKAFQSVDFNLHVTFELRELRNIENPERLKLQIAGFRCISEFFNEYRIVSHGARRKFIYQFSF